MTSSPGHASAGPQPLLRMEGIVKRFGATLALDHATLEIAPGEVHTLLGENGSGKSTLMKVLAGIHRPDAGAINFGGERVRFGSPHAAAEAGIAIVHQELNLVPALSAAENLFLGREERLTPGIISFRRTHTKAAELFAELGIEIDPRIPVAKLSVAMRQMVEIARALTRSVRLLILDEPTSALSDHEVQTLFRIVRRLQKENTAVVYISHKMAEIFELAARYTVLRDGRTVATGAIADATESQIVRSMVGRELGDYYPARQALQPEKRTILRVENLTRPAQESRARKIVDNVSFSLYKGEILGIAGLVGAGRTELIETLFGAAGHDWSGDIFLDDCPIHPTSPEQAISLGMALVAEDRAALGLLFRQSVLDNATIAQLPGLSRAGVLSSRRRREALAEQSRRMRIRRASDHVHIENLSGGNQQKVILARWLMTNPRVLLLDEPTRGIDVGTKSEIYRVLRSLCDAGVGIIFVSSEMPEVLGLADRIIVLSVARITAEFPATEASEEKILDAAMAGFHSADAGGQHV